jgi:hypothetical protein
MIGTEGESVAVAVACRQAKLNVATGKYMAVAAAYFQEPFITTF